MNRLPRDRFEALMRRIRELPPPEPRWPYEDGREAPDELRFILWMGVGALAFVALLTLLLCWLMY